MYRTKHRGSFSHSVYIKRIDATLWRLVLNNAASNGVSVSRFVNTALWLFMVGEAPPDDRKRRTGPRRRSPGQSPTRGRSERS